MIKKYQIIILLLIASVGIEAQTSFPSRDQRIFSLSQIWKEMKYNFAFPEKLQQANIDSLYLEYIPKVENSKDNYEYYRILCSFMSHFNEAHTRIYTSKRIDDVPPIKAMNIENTIIVEDIAKNNCHEIPIGSEIVKINNIPILKYINDSVTPFISASTSQWKFDKSVLELFNGKPHSELYLTIKTPKGKIKNIKMVRNFYSNLEKEPMVNEAPFMPIDIQIIDKNIGYIQLKTCTGNYIETINQVFKKKLNELRKCTSLIVDLRGNRGGSDEAWENIASYLFQDSILNIPVKYYTRINVAAYKNWGQNSEERQLKDYYEDKSMYEITHPPICNKIPDSLKLIQPLVVISGKYVASAAEDFLLLLRQRGKIVGEASVGCVGEPMFIPLGKDMNLMLCAKKFVCPDGSQPNDKGIQPDIYIKNTYEDYLQGRDLILEKAKQILKRQIKL